MCNYVVHIHLHILFDIGIQQQQNEELPHNECNIIKRCVKVKRKTNIRQQKKPNKSFIFELRNFKHNYFVVCAQKEAIIDSKYWLTFLSLSF